MTKQFFDPEEEDIWTQEEADALNESILDEMFPDSSEEEIIEEIWDMIGDED